MMSKFSILLLADDAARNNYKMPDDELILLQSSPQEVFFDDDQIEGLDWSQQLFVLTQPECFLSVLGNEVREHFSEQRKLING